MKRFRAAFFLLLVLTAPVVTAQTSSQLKGQVRLADGTPLPGVTVTASSEDLLGGARLTTSGPNGGYTLPNLPPGLYSVKAELEGFQTQVVEGVRAKLGAVTAVHFTLTETFSGEVLVTGEGPVVDLTSSASGFNYSSDFVEELPLRRHFWDTVGVSPGVSMNFEGDGIYLVAYGAGNIHHSWNVDGASISAPKFGSPWVTLNPDAVEEVQVLGIGAPAEYGSMLGTAINVVTKSGGNELSGNLNAFWQDDALTDANVTLEGNPHPEYTTVKWHDVTASLGGPFERDKHWFFASLQSQRNQFAAPGEDPDFAPLTTTDRADFKLSSRFSESHSLDARVHYHEWEAPWDSAPNVTADATKVGLGKTNPFLTLDWTSVLGENTFVEVQASHWWGEEPNRSLTGSTEPMLKTVHADGSETYSNGVDFVMDFENWENRASVTVSHFAEDLLAGDHDFKFGVQHSNAQSEALLSIGFNGTYYVMDEYYGYGLYQVYQQPYAYASDVESSTVFADDAWQVGDRLSLSLGLRFDHTVGNVLETRRYAADRTPTAEIVPGVSNAVNWDDLAPRFGFAYALGNTSVLRFSFGIYHGSAVSGNWDSPPPEVPTFYAYLQNPATGAFDIPFWEFPNLTLGEIDPDLESPTSFQYALGYERQVGKHSAVGAQLIYRENKDLIGWEILDDGLYEPMTVIDPVSGDEITILNEVEAATKRIGNDPGFTIAGDDAEYATEYSGLILTFNKRFSKGWDLFASYTLSESKGLWPKPTNGSVQGSPLFGNPFLADPNISYVGEQLLQGDRRHMLRVLSNFKLPWGFHGSAVVNLQDGTPYGRILRVRGVGQFFGRSDVIVEPASDDKRLGFQTMVDLAVGKDIPLGRATLTVAVQALNLLNDDAVTRYSHWRPSSAGEYPIRSWLRPRRYMLRFGIKF